MTRGSYLDQLDRHLRSLKREKVKEIIADIYNHFDEGIENGLTEEEVADGLGDPKQLAAEYLELYGETDRREAEPARDGMDFLGIDDEAYQQEWSFEAGQEAVLAIELRSVQLELTAHEGEDVLVSFSGHRRAGHGGQYPRIEARMEGKKVIVQEIWPEFSGLGLIRSVLGRFPRLRGTLSVRAPKDVAAIMAVSHAGGQHVYEVSAGQIDLEASSGGIKTAGATSRGAFTVNTTSGGQSHDRLGGASAVFGASSGGLEVKHSSIQGAATLETNSGGIAVFSMIAGDVEIGRSSGPLTVESLTAKDVKIKGASGSMQLHSASLQSLIVESSSGPIRLSSVIAKGDLTCESASGSIKGEALTAGQLRMHASSGSVHAIDTKAERALFHTASGAIKASFESAADVRAVAASGAVKIALPEDAQFAYDIHTNSGGIEVRFPNGETKRGRGHLQGVIGSADKQIQIETASGSARVYAKGLEEE